MPRIHDLFDRLEAEIAPDTSIRKARPNPGEDGYTAADIEVLEGLEPVRRRPGMYIGGTDINAYHHLFAEVIDNSMDEAIAGHATRIEVHLADVNAAKGGNDDIRCTIEARPEGMQPQTVTHTDASVEAALRGGAVPDLRTPRQGSARQCAVVALDAHEQGAMVFKALVFPEWWLNLPLLFGASMLALEFLRRLISRPVKQGA